MIKHISLCFLLFISLFLNAQTDALLWKITGNDISKPSYLFGTIHVYCEKDKFMTPEFLNYIKSVDEVALELDLNDFNTFVALMKISSEKADESILYKLSSEQISKLDSICIELLDDSLATFKDLSPFSLLSKLMLSESILGCKPIPLDFIVAELAKRENKKTFGLETVEFQSNLLGEIPDSVQIDMLMDFCSDLGKAKAEMSALMAAYNNQNLNDLFKLALSTSPEIGFKMDKMLFERNKKWLENLSEKIKTKSVFIAVGAAHLGGENGLLELMKKDGYILTPIVLKL
jgi:uncharacterized protein YbaP (TraB family)